MQNGTISIRIGAKVWARCSQGYLESGLLEITAVVRSSAQSQIAT